MLLKMMESITRGGIREYTEAVRGRYLTPLKKEKRRILDDFTKVIGCLRGGDAYARNTDGKRLQAECPAQGPWYHPLQG